MRRSERWTGRAAAREACTRRGDFDPAYRQPADGDPGDAHDPTRLQWAKFTTSSRHRAFTRHAMPAPRPDHDPGDEDHVEVVGDWLSDGRGGLVWRDPWRPGLAGSGGVVSVTVTPLHAHYSPAHLAHVVAVMLERGSPVIRAHFDVATGVCFAFEGTHRLRAAKLLGVAPTLVASPWWRSPKVLERARHAARLRGHAFDRVLVVS